MRQAKKLGLPGLVAILLVAGGLFLGGAGRVSKVSGASDPNFPADTATATKTCSNPITGGVPGTPLVTDCTLVITIPGSSGAVITAVGFTDVMLDPNACFLIRGPGDSIVPFPAPGNICNQGRSVVSQPDESVGSTHSDVACPDPGQFKVKRTGSDITGTVTATCNLPEIGIIGPTSLCENVDVTVDFFVATGSGTGSGTGTGGEHSTKETSAKITVCPPNPIIPPPVVNPLTGVTVTKTCTPSFAGALATATISTDCTLVFKVSGSTVFSNGTTLDFDTIQNPGAALFGPSAAGGGGSTTTGCEEGVGGGGILSSSNQTFTCTVGPIIVSGPTTLCESVQLKDPFGNLSPKITVCPPAPPGPTPTAGLNFTAVKTCTTPVPATITAGGSSLTDCFLTFTPLATTAFPAGTFVATDVITTSGATFSTTGSNTLTSTGGTGFCTTDSPSTGAIVGFTLICHLPAIALTTLPNQVCEDVELSAPGLGLSSKINVCGFPPPAPAAAVVVPAPVGLQPTDEFKDCNNTVPGNGNSAQVITAGPAKTFTLPLFNGVPSQCFIELRRPATAGAAATACGGGNPCADGTVVISLTTPGSPAIISCPTNPALSIAPMAAAQATGVSGNGGTCQSQTNGTTLSIPCGVTSGNAASATTVSNTCFGVEFSIASFLTGCITNPTVTSLCPLGNSGFLAQGGTATISVSFLSTPANGGTVGGIQLAIGQNTFSFPPPGVGILLVTATPQLIPSNGTLASIVTATFSCGSGISFGTNGFPLSSLGFSTSTTASGFANQPILAPGPNSGTSAICGAGLPGTFTFSSPGEVLFDNGRQTESVGCGLNGQQNFFGGANPFNQNNFNSTFPLVFTCTGAAVLAIGGGAAGDAPINVTYQSSVGGLTAVGSTLITVAPSGVPRISIQCNPSTIAAGNTGSLCTATVTDVNGIPLSGFQGATVTFTVSDPSVASILPCVVSIPGSINITTSPNVIPQISPNTPCLTASATIPGQSNTFINGQATALLVASSFAHPETVTVTASLGVLIPPSFACLVSPFVPSAGFSQIPGIFGGIFSGNTATSGVGLPGVTGCGLGNPIGFTGLASGLSTAGSGGLTGIVTLPNTTSASTTVNIGGVAGILIAGATITSPLQLSRGCNQIIVTSTIGTPIANIAALVSPTSSVISIWRFSNGTKQWQAGFFSDPAAPTDFIATQSIGSPAGQTTVINNGASTGGNAQVTETYFVCVNQAATIISG